MVNGEDDQGEDYLFKVVMVGECGVGKTNLLTRYAKKTFDLHSRFTVGIDFEKLTREIDGKEIKVQIWDTAGQERYHSLIFPYLRGCPWRPRGLRHY